MRYVEVEFGDQRFRAGDFTHLPTRCKFIALMPQWDFLNFLASAGKRYPTFRLMMATEATDLLRAGDRTIGLTATTPNGPIEIRADLVIGADGRHSRMRDAAGLTVDELGAPMDVLWFRLAYDKAQNRSALGRFAAGQGLVMLDRGDYFQCALIIRKGSAEAVKAEGLAAFRARIAMLSRRASVDEIQNLDEVKLLTVAINRLADWCSPGLMFIGDAAHAMSPIGGVGINLAVQDAVATANILAEPLRRKTVTLDDLRKVQTRRLFPTRATQRLQLIIQNKMVDPMLNSGATPKAPALVRLAQHWPMLQRLPARIIGMGFRPEHVHTVEAR